MKKHAFSILSAVVLAPSLQAAVIYRDDFDRTGNLNGSSTTEGEGTWVSRTDPATTTTGSAATSTSQSTSYLPFVPLNGNIYRISVDVSYPTNTNPPTSFAFYGGLGFFSASSVNAGGVYNANENTPWMFIRGGYNGGSEAARTGDISVRPLPGTGLSNNDINLTTTSMTTLSLTLDTTDSGSWVLRTFYTVDGIETELDSNGVLAGLANIYSGTNTNNLRSGANSIQYVGLSNSSTTSTPIVWDNFVLETIPEPSTALLSVGGLALAFVRRRTAA